jgi:HD superfamily phosphohydrolase YqeK
MALCRAMNRTGAGLDEKRVAAAALLHDIAKGAPDHARAGARMLDALGFDRVGAIVAAHTDLPAEEVQNPQEAAVVYLADKLVGPDRFVPIESRFDVALRRFGRDPAARAAIARRRATALTVKTRVEQGAGMSLTQVLAEAGIRLDAG